MAKPKKPKFVSKLVERVITAAEGQFKAKVITFESQFDNPKSLTSPGGMCSCCGAGPRVDSEYDWWLVFRAGISDGEVMYSMLCGGSDGDGCLEEIRDDNARRKPTFRDEAAAIIAMMNGDDVDGMQTEFEDADALGWLDME